MPRPEIRSAPSAKKSVIRGAPLLSEGVEERAQGGLVPAHGCPYQPARDMVHHDDQILVAALVGDLVNADPAQVGEEVVTGRRVVLDPGDNRPHGPPRDQH